MLKAYNTRTPRRALRVTIESDYLDRRTLAEYCAALDCVPISTDMFISVYRKLKYPVINIDEYFNYIELMGIDLFKDDQARKDTFPILVEILETKYGIEYVDSEK